MSNTKHFVVRSSKFRRVFRGMMTVGLPLLALIMHLFDLHYPFDPESTPVFKGGLVLFGVIFLPRFISALSWKYTIEGNDIHYRTLFRRGTISFSDIKRVWLYREGVRRLNHRAVERKERLSLFEFRNYLDFHMEHTTYKTGWLLPAIPETAENYPLFVECLKRRKIPGAKKLQ